MGPAENTGLKCPLSEDLNGLFIVFEELKDQLVRIEAVQFFIRPGMASVPDCQVPDPFR